MEVGALCARDATLLPPTVGKLAGIELSLIVTPPPGLEAGYVPIVTRQAAKDWLAFSASPHA
jgi:hypothetical protein